MGQQNEIFYFCSATPHQVCQVEVPPDELVEFRDGAVHVVVVMVAVDFFLTESPVMMCYRKIYSLGY